MNERIFCTVCNTAPVNVEYAFTESGLDFLNVLDAMLALGLGVPIVDAHAGLILFI